MKTRFKKFTVLHILWDDTTSETKWQDIKNLKTVIPTKVKTIGFYINTQNNSILLAHSISSDNDCDYTIIPLGCIESIKELKNNENKKNTGRYNK